MKPRNREINIFNLSMLDVISGALGAFLIIMVVLFPYYKKDFIAENQALRQGVGVLGGELEDCNVKLDSCKAANASLGAANDSLGGLIAGLKGQLEDCQNKLTGVGNSVDDIRKQLQRCMRNKAVLQDSITKLQNQTEVTLFGIPKKAGHVVYVVDVSESMKDPVQTAALDQTLDELFLGIEAEYFNIIYFSTQATVWNRGWMSGTLANRKVGMNYCKRLTKQGSTNSYGALESALAMSRAEMVYFITDGQPTAGPKTEPTDILAQVKIWNSGKKVQIFSVMVGVPPGGAATRELYSFLKQLALNNRGKYIGR